jgi:Domain of unknown function (DUF4157)
MFGTSLQMSSQDSLRDTPAPARTALVQRKCACESSGQLCPACARKQARAMTNAAAAGARPSQVPPVVRDVVRSEGRPLDAETRTFMESRFGRRFDGVRVHADSAAARSARAVNAEAFTVGQHIAFSDGAYKPHEPDGKRLLAHELAHVVQQGPVRPDAELEVAPANGPGEHEAESTAARVVETTGAGGTGARTFAAQVGAGTTHVALGRASIARQSAQPQRTRLQCINNLLSNAGIPWAVIGLAGSVCGLIGAIAGLATGPGAPAASPSAAAVAAAYCIAAVTGASFGMVLGVITRCIQDPSVEWVFSQNEAGGAGSPGGAGAGTAPTATASAATPGSAGGTGATGTG